MRNSKTPEDVERHIDVGDLARIGTVPELDGAQSAWSENPEGNILAINQLGA